MRSKFFFILAIIMGLVTTALFYNYMSQMSKETVLNETLVDVIVAKEKISRNQMISANVLQLSAVPAVSVHPNSVQSLEQVIGAYATSDIEPGETILTHRVQKEVGESEVLARKVRNGYRAVSVGVNFVQSISNMIHPNDYVDVIVSEQVQVGDQKIIQSQLILEKVKVLAIGRKMLEATSPESYVEYTSVTLELTSQDSVKLVNAAERGEIQFTMHSRILPPKEGAANEKLAN
ncbi:Flp pilus assembly protein CpaB [Desulfuribacillus stibiiarsenatis]|uniref:Flp pilus assembly protein CpaB n=1 Tax=Desulfuribacillus stibiiarsenatis TaxID=1390249 RepID=A0A1E5L7S6_9FIRM|nr:Flp pilus assembly protein CpaB [Desulfuribacillus stibiiarsenatis]OEH86186.1 Flp pilus assembly protein CpaB [Desulfuribacillus stibiiarsenatis]